MADELTPEPGKLIDYPARCAAHRAAGNIYGRLLEAEAAYIREVERLSVERARLESALEILDENL